MSRTPANFRRLVAVALAAGIALTAGAEDPPPAKKKTPEPDGSAEVKFADGSTVRMVLTQSAVEVTTRYGKLSVPVADIRKIEFGFRYPEGVEAKIDALVRKLALPDAKDREAAVRELLGFRELAYPALRRVAAGTDAELASRANAAIRQLEEKVGADKLRVRDQDTIHTTEFVVTGKIEAPTLKGLTTYFGEVSVQVSEVRTIRFLGGTGLETELVLDAAKYGAHTQDQWLDTEIDVADGAVLEVTAAGLVDLWPQGGNYKVGPDAMPRMGVLPDGTPCGMLVGRVGPSGSVIQLGAKYSGTVSDGGRLYLRIVGSPWGNPSGGSYTVKVNPNADGSALPAAPVKPIKKKTAGIAKDGTKKN